MFCYKHVKLHIKYLHMYNYEITMTFYTFPKLVVVGKGSDVLFHTFVENEPSILCIYK